MRFALAERGLTLADIAAQGMEPTALQHEGRRVFVHSGDYRARVAELEAEGLSTSDAQGAVDAELLAAAARS